MINKSDFIMLDITKEDILNAIEISKEQVFIDNLRSRSPIIKFDSCVRGNLGELGIKSLFSKRSIKTEETPSVQKNGCNIDLLVSRGNKRTPLTTEIKTSKVPDSWGSLYECVQKGDIKILTNETETISKLREKRDVYIQIYYDIKSQAHDRELKLIFSEKFGCDTVTDISFFQRLKSEDIYQNFGYQQYLERVFFVGWVDSLTLCDYLNTLGGDSKYSIEKRWFWKCKLSDTARTPTSLISYLKLV